MQSNPEKKKQWLSVEIVPGVYQRFSVEKEMTIGREESNGIFLNAPSVSGKHAAVGIEGNQAWIQDLESTNGTFINQVQIKRQYLKDQDCIKLGEARMVFEEENPERKNSWIKKTGDVFLDKADNFLSQQKHVLIRFFPAVLASSSSPIQILFSSVPARDLPDAMEVRESCAILEESHGNIRIMPVCPGCLVNPPFQDIQIGETPAKREFWITPLSQEGKVNASLHFIHKEKILKISKIPFSVLPLYLHRIFFALALFLPIAGILLDLPAISLNRNLPQLVYSMVFFIRMLGGPSVCGFLAGTLCLGMGFASFWRGKKKGYCLLQEELSV
ncbi:MAG: FHA domain-containing protein [Candidatus Brocadiae bacterium]|nr:FHA domain-containing protein [Candidatus Brocadiia bacterium]